MPKSFGSNNWILIRDGAQPELCDACISRIGPARGRSSTVRIYWDDGTVWRAPKSFVEKHEIGRGTEVSEELRLLLWKDIQNARALTTALSLVGMRDHTFAELKRKLRLRSFRREAVEFALVEIGKLNIVNEPVIAERVASIRLKKPGKGVRIIINELTHKGIERSTAADIVRSIADDESQLSSARKWLSKRGGKYLPAEGDGAKVRSETRMKAARALYRHGYETHIISRLMDEIFESS
ncbi:regulatory protein RecX [bacterium]|nr:regulatory protein RecX [bacterium]